MSNDSDNKYRFDHGKNQFTTVPDMLLYAMENHENLLICSIWKEENYCKDLLLKQYKNLKNQINDLKNPEYRKIIKKQ